MNDAQLTDLKQYLDSRFTLVDNRFEQIDVRFAQMDKRFEQIASRFTQTDKKIDGLRQEMRDGFAGVADVMETTNQLVERRLSRLEHQTGIL